MAKLMAASGGMTRSAPTEEGGMGVLRLDFGNQMRQMRYAYD